MPRRLRQTAVRFGIAPAILRFAYGVLQKTMIFDVTYLMVMDAHRAPAPPPAVESLTFRFLGSDDVQRLSNEPGNCVSPDLARRLDSGLDLCYAALHGDLLASYCWLALDSIEPIHNRGARLESGVGLSYSKNAAFIYNGFTHPDFRGRGVYPQLMHNVSIAMREQGVSYILSTTDWTNFAALRGCCRAGKRRIGMIWRFGWPKWMKTIARSPQLGRLTIHIGESAHISPRQA